MVSTFDDLGLKEDLLRGIYAYSTSIPHAYSLLRSTEKVQTLKSPLPSSSVPFFRSSKDAMSLHKRNPVPEKPRRSLSPSFSPST